MSGCLRIFCLFEDSFLVHLLFLEKGGRVFSESGLCAVLSFFRRLVLVL